MLTTPDAPGHPVEFAKPSFRRRRRILVAAGVVVLTAWIALLVVLTIDAGSNGETSVLIGTLDSGRIEGTAVLFVVVALTLGICMIPVPRLWLILLIPARFAAILASFLGAFAWSMVVPSVTVVPLVDAGCETGYIVEERSFFFPSGGTVYRTDGVLVTSVERLVGGDSFHPVSAGDYAVTANDEGLTITVGDTPSFTLPKLRHEDRVCDLADGVLSPSPLPPTAPQGYSYTDAEESLQHMTRLSFESAVGPLRDVIGNDVDPATAVAPSRVTCSGGGARASLRFEFETHDNATSVARILEAWDSAGYDADRAMHEDIRYSDTLPIERMSIRDTTSIDGLIHMAITSQCSS